MGRKPKSVGERNLDRIVGANVARLRQAQGADVRELAERLEITISMVHKVEQGVRGLTLYQLVKVHRLFGCSLDELIFGEKHKPEHVKRLPIISMKDFEG